MSTNANVHSLEAIETVQRAMMTFVDQVDNALAELSGEMRRMLEWLEHDRPRHWRTQVRISIDQVHEAQQALHRCLMFPVANERPSCYEERAALKKAQARQAYCEEKVERVRHWQKSVQHELFEYEGRISQLVQLADIDMPHAIGVLTKIIRRLEDYQSVRAADPRQAYQELAQELWPETKEEAKTEAEGEDASGGKDLPAEESGTAGEE